ncbi:MAG: hypothetical protein Q9182_004954 [Xanthomendoza sp. 2 TL-2023]
MALKYIVVQKLKPYSFINKVRAAKYEIHELSQTIVNTHTDVFSTPGRVPVLWLDGDRTPAFINPVGSNRGLKVKADTESSQIVDILLGPVWSPSTSTRATSTLSLRSASPLSAPAFLQFEVFAIHAQRENDQGSENNPKPVSEKGHEEDSIIEYIAQEAGEQADSAVSGAEAVDEEGDCRYKQGTTTAIMVLVFNHLLNVIWQNIQEGPDLPQGDESKKHCEDDGSGACTAPPVFMTCPCHANTEASRMVARDGPGLVIVRRGLLGNWQKEWFTSQSGIKLIIGHADFKEMSLTGEAIEELRCARSRKFTMPNPPFDGDLPEKIWRHTGQGKRRQSKYVLLTTHESFVYHVDHHIGLQYSWQTWSSFQKRMLEFTRFIPALCPAWTVADTFQDQYLPPYFAGLSGTPLQLNPDDLLGPLTALKDHTSAQYKEDDHDADPMGICVADLKHFTKRFKEAGRKTRVRGKEDFEALCAEFGTQLASFIIRRADDSCWMGLRVLELVKLEFTRVKVAFPQRYREGMEGLLSSERSELEVDLKRRQKEWMGTNEKKRKGEYPTDIDLSLITTAARQIQLLASIPYLTEFWDKHCMGHEKSLAQHFFKEHTLDRTTFKETSPLYTALNEPSNLLSKFPALASLVHKAHGRKTKVLVFSTWLVVAAFAALVRLPLS